MENRKKYLCKVTFHKDYKNPDFYYKSVLLEKNNEEYTCYNFNNADERLKYINDVIHVDGELETLPEQYEITEEKDTTTYLFKRVINHSCYSFNDWAVFSFVFSDEDQEDYNYNDDFIDYLDKCIHEKTHPI